MVKAISLSFLLLASPELLWAKNGNLGAVLSKPYIVNDPNQQGELGQLALQITVAYKLNPDFSLGVGFETEIESTTSNDLNQSVTIIMTQSFWSLKPIHPYVRAEAIFIFDPNIAMGARMGPGLRFELFPVLGVDGAYLTAQMSLRALYEGADDSQYALDLPRLGFEYDF